MISVIPNGLESLFEDASDAKDARAEGNVLDDELCDGGPGLGINLDRCVSPNVILDVNITQRECCEARKAETFHVLPL